MSKTSGGLRSKSDSFDDNYTVSFSQKPGVIRDNPKLSLAVYNTMFWKIKSMGFLTAKRGVFDLNNVLL